MATQLPQIDFDQVQRVLTQGTFSLVLGARDRRLGGFTLRRVDMDENVVPALKAIPTEFLAHARDLSLVAFDLGYRPESQEAMVLNAEQFGQDSLVTGLADPSSLSLFSPNDDSFGQPVLYAFVATLRGSSLVLVRKSPQTQIGRTKRFVGLVRQGRLQTLDQPVLGFDAKIDAMVFGNNIIVVNSSAFQEIFKDIDALRANVEADVQAIQSQIPIANMNEFLEACERDSRMMTKLGQVAARPYLNELTVDDIRGTIARHNLPQDLLNDQGEFVFNRDPQTRWQILKILDDDFLESQMTQRLYEVNSKLEHGSA